MQIGCMNNPHTSVYKELEWIGKKGFDFVDFTIEPTKAMHSDIDVSRAKRIMRKYNLGIVGHMGDWMLPKDSGYKSLRDASRNEMLAGIRILRRLGAKRVTIHSPRVQIRDYRASLQRHTELIRDVLSEARKHKLEIMLENNSDYITNPQNGRLLHHLLRKFPALKLHIDVAHANIGVKTNDVYNLMRRYEKRVRHFHFSDNFGEEDDHLKLGAGSIKWERIIKFLKNKGYEGTITVEVIRSGKAGKAESLRKLRKWWDAY